MRILIVTPAGSGTRIGNRITALRMAALLRGLGHEVKLRGAYDEVGADVMIALHALKSADAMIAASARSPRLPSALVLTGTDVYGAIQSDARARHSLELADAIVVLQPRAMDELDANARAKTRLILQSAVAPRDAGEPDPAHFDVCLLAHLRAVKDPLLAARAARMLPATSRVRIVHVGSALDDAQRLAAEREMRENPRYQWLGAQRYGESLRVLARSRVMVLSSHNEGGPAVVTEAIACGVPVLSTRIPASEGLLGKDHPGLYPVGDAPALAQLLTRCEQNAAFLADLRARSVALQASVEPAREARDLRALLAQLIAH